MIEELIEDIKIFFSQPLFSNDMNYYSSTPIDTFKKKEIKKIVKYSLKWCISEFGPNNRKQLPITIDFDHYGDDMPGYYGMYCPVENVIYINLDECNTLGRLTSTIIHEFTHYKQPILTKYAKAHKEHGYWDNPFEVEARQVEKKFNRYLLSDLRANL
jgi:hypothetical protein